MALAAAVLGLAAASEAQLFPGVRWKLEPTSSVVTITVVQQVGGNFTLTGFEDDGAERGALYGTAFPQSDGRFAMGFTTVFEGGAVQTRVENIDPATLSGTWSDDSGNGGPFLLQ
jgi:hypothetical protein